MQKKLLRLHESMGKFCRKIVVLEYGTTPEEQVKNLSILNKLALSLNDGDNIYFDISHAYRSLSFYELLAVNLAKNVMMRNIRIEMVSYAMLEASRLYGGKTPIVDMTQLIELLDWARAVDDYNRSGHFHLLLELLKGSNKIGTFFKKQMSKKVRQAFTTLVETMSANNNYGDYKHMIELIFNALTNQNIVLEHPLLLIVNKIMSQIYDFFCPYKDDNIALLLASVLWKIRKGQIVLGALLLVDAVESVCLDILGKKFEDEEEARDMIHAKLINAYSEDKYVSRLIINYNAVRKYRNKLAHGKPVDNRMLSIHIENEAVEILSLYTKYFAPDRPQREMLKMLFT